MATENIKNFTIRVDNKTGKMAVDDLTQGFVKQETAVRKLNNAIEKSSEELNSMVNKSGLAGAAVVEIGRTISDANYGFTAMANNISQLATLFTTLIATTKGFRNALIALKDAFLGPLGIIVAFQIVIFFLERLAKKQEEAAEATKYLDTQIQAQTSAIESLIERLEDANLLEEERLNILSSLSQVNKDLEAILSDRTKTEDELLESLRNYLRIEKLRNEADAIGNALKEETLANDDERIRLQNEINKAQRMEANLVKELNVLGGESYGVESTLGDLRADIKILQGELNTLNEQRNVIEEDYIFILNKLNKEEGKTLAAAPRTIDFYNQQIKRLEEVRDSTATTASQYKVYSDAIEEVEKKIKEITGEEEKQSKKRKGFTQQFLDFNKEILESENRLTKLTTVNKEEQIKADSDLLIKRAEERQKDFALRQQERVNAIQDAKERAKAQIKADESIRQSAQSLADFREQIEIETNAKIENFRLDSIVKNLGILYQELEQRKILELEFQTSMATNEMDRIELSRQLENQKTATVIGNLELERQKALQAGESVIGIDAKIATERDKIRKVNAQLDEKERKTKIAIANEVGNAIIGIAGEGSAVGKSVAVAMAIMNTKEAITNALGAKPYGPWNIAQALAVGAFGFKQVQDIINTKIPGKAGSAAGVGAGGAAITTEAPDFNVVGIGQASQLGQVIGSQFGQPIRAYVVSNDVNTGQALERSITGNAKLD